MAQPEFVLPDFLENQSADEIHERMMKELPPDIDDMPGGFPYDFTMPAALEKAELINYHLARSLMLAFPQYAWDEWLDMHGAQVHVERHPAVAAKGFVKVTTSDTAAISAGSVFCTAATESSASIEFTADEDVFIDGAGEALIAVTAVEPGTGSNVAAGTVSLMAVPEQNVTTLINPEPISGGTERESNDDYYDRILAEYANSTTFVGNDTDYIRWAKAAGAGDCVVISAYNGPGTVKLVIVDSEGRPAGRSLIDAVYNYIVSPNDRSARLLPTACAELVVDTAETFVIDYAITGIIFDGSVTSINRIKEDFKTAVLAAYEESQADNILRYNDVRPLIKGIAGVEDFVTFTMNGGTENIELGAEEYPVTGELNFTEAV